MYNDDFGIGLMFGVFLGIITGTLISLALYTNRHKNDVEVSDPKKLEEISRKPTKPDTLIGYRIKDTYYFEILTNK